MGTLTYRPGKADEQKWDWDPADPDFDIAYTVEVETDWPWQVFLTKYGLGSHVAIRALVYAFLKRDNDRLRISNVQVKYDDILFEASEAEKKAAAKAEKSGDKKRADKPGEA